MREEEKIKYKDVYVQSVSYMKSAVIAVNIQTNSIFKLMWSIDDDLPIHMYYYAITVRKSSARNKVWWKIYFESRQFMCLMIISRISASKCPTVRENVTKSQLLE